MNIIVISILLPYPLNSGGAQAQFNLIDKLRKKHNITFIFPENGQNTMSAMKKLQEMWPEVNFCPYRYVLQLTDLKFFVSKIKRAFNIMFRGGNERFKVERILKPYGFPLNNRFRNFINTIVKRVNADVVQVEFYPFLSLVETLPKEVLKVFVHHEIRYVRNDRMLSDFQLTADENMLRETIKITELSDLNKYDRVVTLTQNDKEVLEKSGVNKPIYVSPAAVDSEVRQYAGWNGRIAFLGGYGHAPNNEGVDWFIRDVLPELQSMTSRRLILDIVGKGWPVEYEKTNPQNEIKLRGFVECLPDAVCGTIMIVPILSGSGMRMKILEAAALGVPFITTTVGVEGLKFKDKESCIIADTSEDFAKGLALLMEDELLRQQLTQNASKVFEENYSVESLSAVRNRVYQ